MSSSAPRVSVVMAVHDAGPFVGAAVESVLGQSFGDLELLVVDDASTDDSAAVLDRVRDPRLVRLSNGTHVGAAAARNRALAVARGEYVAVHDADDLSRPERLATQVAFLERHGLVAACGTHFDRIDAAGRRIREEIPYPCSDALVAWWLLLFANPIAHSSAMFRRDVLWRTGPYDPALEAAHDREFLSRVFRAGRIAVLPEDLVTYRVHDASLGARHRPVQRANSLRVRRDLLRWFLGDGAPVEAVLHWYDAPIPPDHVEPLVDLFLRTYTEIVRRFEPSPEELSELRSDLEARLASVRRRDGRIPPDRLSRAYWKSVLPAPVVRLLRRFLG